MNNINQYINNILGTETRLQPLPNKETAGLPLYMSQTYKFWYLELYNQLLILVEPKTLDDFSIKQTETHFDILRKVFAKRIVLAAPEMTAIQRQRLIEKKINFIVPEKQLYIPELLLDLREQFPNPQRKEKKESLLPSAQYLVIHHILNKEKEIRLEKIPFKDIAEITGYSAMAITKAVENLRYHELVEVHGERKKFIRFTIKDKAELLHAILKRKLFIDPVLKRVFIENRPSESRLPHSNASALPEYTDLNATSQEYFAIEKHHFYALLKNNAFHDLNDYEGKYCIEVWKYNPNILLELVPPDALVVDPLSLYLSLQDSHDERVQMGLDQLLERAVHG